MKFSFPLFVASTTIAALGTVVQAIYYEGASNTWYGDAGDFLQCPDTGNFITGYCSSGRSATCVDYDYPYNSGYKSYWTAMNCSSVADITGEPQSGGTSASLAATSYQSSNNWQCGDAGDELSCLAGQAMIGACGVGQHPRCTTECQQYGKSGQDSGAYSAILCDYFYPPNKDGMTLDSGTWEPPMDKGAPYTCPAGSVACGVCQSGEGYDCNGKGWRLRCCKPTNVLYTVVGKWEALTQLPSASSLAYSYGYTMSKGETWTDEWSYTVTDSVETGVEVGVGSMKNTLTGSYSKSMAHSDSASWSVSYGAGMTYHFDETYAGNELWQWVYYMYDQPGDIDYSSKAMSQNYVAVTDGEWQQPACIPGYAKNNDYTLCHCIEAYIPGTGYEPPAGLPHCPGYTDSPTPATAVSSSSFATITSSSTAQVAEITAPAASTAFLTTKDTFAPTYVPAVAYTPGPSAVVTAASTNAPTTAPSSDPTAAPTSLPTAEPTAAPTNFPTTEPTFAPTTIPTADPTSTPTVFPTATPTQSQNDDGVRRFLRRGARV